MFKAFYASRKWALWAYGGGALLLISLIAQVQMTVLINEWYQGFYDILQNAKTTSVDRFWEEIVNFCEIAFPYVLLATATSYLTRLYSFRWREAITFDYIPKWRNVASEIEGASQRIQEDAQKFAMLVETLGLQIARALMTLIAFIPILWTLSSHITFGPFADIKGSLVWAALVIALGGMAASWFIGWYLPGLEYNNQKVEAAFRKELVYGEDDKVQYSLFETLVSLFVGIRVNYHRLYLHYGYFDIWLNTYSQAMVIIPFVIVGPGLFLAGGLTLGLMMRIINAFGEVRESLNVLIVNWTKITELRSVYKRLREFETNLRLKG